MITKIMICSHCGKEFSRTNYPSAFKRTYKTACCSKYCAMRHANPFQYVTIKAGHAWIRDDKHPNCNANSQIPMAHVIMENLIGRYLDKGEVVHHIDGNGLNNSLDNLQIMSISEHVKHHNSLKTRKSNGQFIPKDAK